MSPIIGALAVRGVFWTGAGQILRQVVQVIAAVVLARLLAPSDFGLLGMAMFFIGIGQLFADFGIGTAIVQAQSADRVVLSSCFWLNFAVASIFALAVLLASPLIGDFYRRNDLVPLIAVLSLNLLLAGLQSVPQALLYRDLRFAELALSQVLGSLAGAALAVALAWAGAGVWSLVAQPLAGSTIGLALCLAMLRWRPHLEFSWIRVRPLARFSMAMLGTSLFGYASRNVDSLLVGRYLGAGPLGIYAMAIQLMLFPLQQVSSVIVRVLFPTLVQIRDDVPRLRSAYLRAVAAIAVVTFPMTAGLFAVADDFVTVVFGPSWTPMIPVLKVLAWVGMFQSIGTTVGTIYLSTGRAGLALRVTMISTPVLIFGMAAGLPWGILGVAVGYGTASFSLFYFTLRMAFPLVNLRIREFHAMLGPPLAASLAMAAVVLTVVVALPGMQPVARLSIAVATGVAAYVAFSALLNRHQVQEIVAVLRSVRGARAG